MPAVKTVGFHYDRDAFAKATEKLEQGKPSHYDAAGLEEAIGRIVGLIREKGYSEQDVIDALQDAEEGITGTTMSDERIAILRALVRKAVKAERQTRQAASAKPLSAAMGKKPIGKSEAPAESRKPREQLTPPNERKAETQSNVAAPRVGDPAVSNQLGQKPNAASTAGGAGEAGSGRSTASDSILSMFGTRSKGAEPDKAPRDGGSAETPQAGGSFGSGGN